MSTRRATITLLAAFVAAAPACKKKDQPPGATGSGSAAAGPAAAGSAAAGSAAPKHHTPRTPAKAGTIKPIATDHTLAIAVAKTPTWVEGDFACYQAGIGFDPTAHAMDTFAQIKPDLPAALGAAHFDLEHDLLAIGGMSCPSDLCIYAAVKLSGVDQGKQLVEHLLPGPLEKVDDSHFVAKIQGPTGPRAIHVHLVPLDWDGVDVPDDARARRLRTATHVLFLSAAAADQAAPDPFSLLAPAADATTRLHALEALAADPRGRCAIGEIARSADFRPGYDLEGARFVVLNPPKTDDDEVAKMMSAQHGLDVEIALDLSKAPSKAEVDGWVAQARSWFDGVVAQTPAPPQIASMLRLFLESAFTYKIDDHRVLLSWKTSRIPRSQLEAMDSQLSGMFH
jgi:hypothetical protein